MAGTCITRHKMHKLELTRSDMKHILQNTKRIQVLELFCLKVKKEQEYFSFLTAIFIVYNL